MIKAVPQFTDFLSKMNFITVNVGRYNPSRAKIVPNSSPFMEYGTWAQKKKISRVPMKIIKSKAAYMISDRVVHLYSV